MDHRVQDEIDLAGRGVIIDQSTEALLALVGNSNGSFVPFLINQFGHRLGISRLESITVCRMGADVHWNFA